MLGSAIMRDTPLLDGRGIARDQNRALLQDEILRPERGPLAQPGLVQRR